MVTSSPHTSLLSPLSSPSEHTKQACPALFISAPGSGHGKSTVTAALARLHCQNGLRVRVYKTGPDFLDPMLLEQACGQTVYQLDPWLAGMQACQKMVLDAVQHADLILIEGVMGLFDGTPCSADLAQHLGVPVLAVMNVHGMAQTLGALVSGLAHYRPELPFFGVFANGVASLRHEEMLRQGIPDDIGYYGGMPRSQHFSLPERHLGLVPVAEIDDLERRLSAVCAALAKTRLAQLPPVVEFEKLFTQDAAMLISTSQQSALQRQQKPLQGVKIAIARDAAFSFLYPANLDCLQELGAQLIFFSPLQDSVLPQADSLYLPGGYPELHLQKLQENQPMKQAIQQHFMEDKPIYAECGGMLYLLESLRDKHGNQAQMVGILRGHGMLQARLQGLGYQSLNMPQGTLRCHTFHYSVIDTPWQPMAEGETLFNTSPGERVFQERRLTASYLHAYFPSAPMVIAHLFMPQQSVESGVGRKLT